VKLKAKENIMNLSVHFGGSIDPFKDNPDLTNVVKDFIAKYINKNFSVSFTDQEKLLNIIFQGLRSGRDTNEIGQKMETVLGSQTDIYQVALDAIMRPRAFQDIYMQQKAGARYYTWQTVEDARVRPEHQKLNGKIFAYSPKDATKKYPYIPIYPGSEHLCRCIALPEFSIY
jgi:SPP1 gp7 family putative phage head morphogenesis protein